jgi:signal recognition particle GTPase
MGLHASTIMANTSHQYVGILDPNSIRRSDQSDTWRRYEQFKMTVFIQQKGGVGKTTMSYATAYGLARAGNTVLYVDADSQRNGNISAIAKHVYHNYHGDCNAFFRDTSATDTLLTALR